MQHCNLVLLLLNLYYYSNYVLNISSILKIKDNYPLFLGRPLQSCVFETGCSA